MEVCFVDLKKRKGIFVDVDGSEHAFGTMKYALAAELEDDNYHDDAFKKDLLNTEWFKSLNFDYSGNINADITGLAKIGIITFINACSLNVNGTHYNAYAIAIPKKVSDSQRGFLEREYSNIKEAIDSTEAYLFGEVISGSDDTEPFYNLDELYDYCGLKRVEKDMNNNGFRR